MNIGPTTSGTSLIITLLNEASAIRNLLESIREQTRPPDEIIIVDAGSTDDTIASIKAFTSENPDMRIQVLVKKGCNISEGRNTAISRAAGDIILTTDGGCFLAENWVEEILLGFETDEVDVVAGTYEAWSENWLQACMAKILVPAMTEFRPGFLPSSRSVAFRKSAWAAVSGYPENLCLAEDTKFILALLNLNKQLVVCKRAKVFWRQRKSVRQFARQVFLYAKWDAIARTVSTPTVLRSTTNSLCLLLSVFYSSLLSLYIPLLGYSIWRLRERFGTHDLYLLPGVLVLRVIEECCRTAGYAIGAMVRIR